MDRDFYNVLGVPRSADTDEIKRAYRALALRWHPDRNPGDPSAEARFKDISEAWRVLSDAEQRARYDRLGPLYSEDGRPPRPDEVSDVVSRMWDNLWGRRKKTRGEDLRYTLTVSLEEVATGGSRELAIARRVRCVSCDGTGAPADQREICRSCNGTGKAGAARLFRTTCYPCGGRGYVRHAVCGICSGDGLVGSQDLIRLKVPPGVATGSKLKVAQKGNDAPENPTGPGNLIVVVHVAEHPLFRRRGDDLVCEVPVSIADATLGADVRVPVLDGNTTIRIPAGTPHGKMLRLAGRGLPKVGGTARGDLQLEVQIEVPAGLDEAERARLGAWAAALQSNRHPRKMAFQRAVEERLR